MFVLANPILLCVCVHIHPQTVIWCPKCVGKVFYTFGRLVCCWPRSLTLSERAPFLGAARLNRCLCVCVGRVARTIYTPHAGGMQRDGLEYLKMFKRRARLHRHHDAANARCCASTPLYSAHAEWGWHGVLGAHSACFSFFRNPKRASRRRGRRNVSS